jgi:hypothetical protein
MLKYILLATTMTIATPVMAQEVTTENPPASQPAPVSPAPVEEPTTTPAPAEQQAAPAPAEAQAVAQTPPAPATPTVPAEGQPTETAAQPAQPVTPAEQPAAATAQAPAPAATERPATSQSQVAEVVTKEFPVYDKDASGALDTTEFAAWMGALRKASEPTFDTASAEANTWIGQAFAQADADKNKSVNQGELTTFLTPKAS